MTLFLWSERIGAITGERDDNKVAYYKRKVDEIRDTDESLPTNASLTPLIAGSFNDWHYEKMQEVVPFCMDNDLNPPDFLKECVAEGNIKSKNLEKLSKGDQEVVRKHTEEYYKANW